MYRLSLALLTFCFSCVIAHGQSMMRAHRVTAEVSDEATADQVVATRAMLLLKRLDDEVIVYQSLGDFAEGRKLANVSLDDFKIHLHEARAEVESISPLLTDRRLAGELRNAMASFRDGAFWWERIDQPRVINVSSMTAEKNPTATETFLMANAPYTVALHWRQAHKYWQKAVRRFAGLSQF
jgi:hypothetical protein